MLRLVLAFAAPLLAQEPVTLVFPSGGELKGVLVDESGPFYVLTRDGGRLEFPKESVSEVRREPNAEGDYAAREAALPAGDAAALWELARWADDNGLPGRAKALAARVLKADPEHLGARARLGYEFSDGAWRRGTDLMRAKGWVRHGGVWMTLAERRAALEEESRAAQAPPAAPTPVVVRVEVAAVRPAYDPGVFTVISRPVMHPRRRDPQGRQPWRPEPFRFYEPVLRMPPADTPGTFAYW